MIATKELGTIDLKQTETVRKLEAHIDDTICGRLAAGIEVSGFYVGVNLVDDETTDKIIALYREGGWTVTRVTHLLRFTIVHDEASEVGNV